MLVMGRIAGIKKEKITISISHGNTRRIEEAIARNEFSNVSEAINEAITFFFENKNSTAITKEWLLSAEGKELIKGIMKNTMED